MKTLKIKTRRILSSLRRFLRNEEGSNLVETGLGMTVYLAFFFAVIQFSYGLYVYNTINEVSREATRWAVVRGTECGRNMSASFCSPYAANSTGAVGSDIQNYVQSIGFPGMNKSLITVSTNWYTASTSTPTAGNPVTWSLCKSSSCNQPGSQVQVTVSYPVPLPIPFWKNLTLNVSSTSQMVVVE